MEYKIGDFSLLCRLTVKTLRYYHDIGLLVPIRADHDTGYRWYDEGCLSRAAAIRTLKDLEFSLDEIKDTLADAQDDTDLTPILRTKLASLEAKMARDRVVQNQILSLINSEEGDAAMAESLKDARWAALPAVHFAGIRFTGRYDEVGKHCATLFRLYGRWVSGPPFALYYDGEYKETDADIEVCVPLNSKSKIPVKEGTRIADLPAATVAEVIHVGPYSDLGRSYKKVMDLVASAGKHAQNPTREFYLKGPGMIIPRSPKKFITLVQIPVSD